MPGTAIGAGVNGKQNVKGVCPHGTFILVDVPGNSNAQE